MEVPILAVSGCLSCAKSMLMTLLALCALATIVGCTSRPTEAEQSNTGGNTSSPNVELTFVNTTLGSGEAVYRVTATNRGTLTAFAVKLHGQEVRQNLYAPPTTLSFTQSIALQINAGQSSSVDVLEWRDVWHRLPGFTVTWTE